MAALNFTMVWDDEQTGLSDSLLGHWLGIPISYCSCLNLQGLLALLGFEMQVKA